MCLMCNKANEEVTCLGISGIIHSAGIINTGSSCLLKLNSSDQDYCPQVIACSTVSLTAFLKMLPACSVATDKYANSGAVGFRCMILAGFVVMNWVSSHKGKKNSAVTQLPRPPQGVFV